MIGGDTVTQFGTASALDTWGPGTERVNVQHTPREPKRPIDAATVQRLILVGAVIVAAVAWISFAIQFFR